MLLSETQWDNVLGLEIDLPYAFEGLSDAFTQDIDKWKEWIQGKEPHRADLPGKWSLPPKVIKAVAADDESDEAELEEDEEDTGTYGLTAFQKLSMAFMAALCSSTKSILLMLLCFIFGNFFLF